MEDLKNNIQLEYKTEVTEESGKRIYTDINNTDYISVTSLLSDYEDTSALVTWRNKIGEEEASFIRDSTVDRGKKTHSVIENFLTTGKFIPNLTSDVCNIHAKLAIDTFFSRVRYVSAESVVFYKDSSVRYAGRYDSVVYIPESTFYFKDTGEPLLAGNSLVDLKTKNKFPRLDKVDYLLKYALQGSAYTKGIDVSTDLNIKYFIVVLTTDKNCKLICLDRECLDFYFNRFYRLLLHYYSLIEDVEISWKHIINQASCFYDFETDCYKSYMFREILPYTHNLNALAA